MVESKMKITKATVCAQYNEDVILLIFRGWKKVGIVMRVFCAISEDLYS